MSSKRPMRMVMSERVRNSRRSSRRLASSMCMRMGMGMMAMCIMTSCSSSSLFSSLFSSSSSASSSSSWTAQAFLMPSSSTLIIRKNHGNRRVVHNRHHGVLMPSNRLLRISELPRLLSLSKLRNVPKIFMHPHANLAVALDQPLLPKTNMVACMVEYLISLFSYDTTQIVCAAVVIGWILSQFIRRITSNSNNNNSDSTYRNSNMNISGGMNNNNNYNNNNNNMGGGNPMGGGSMGQARNDNSRRRSQSKNTSNKNTNANTSAGGGGGGGLGLVRWVRGILFRTLDLLTPKKEGVPMSFSMDNDGWGVCTLRSKRRFGKTSFIHYEFDLPQSNFILPLKLGQQASLCCLDNSGSVAKGGFYVYHPKSDTRLGVFSILAPNKGTVDNEYMVGADAANLARVLKDDLKVGDEIALKLGDRRLEYRGQHFPVTQMVYIASGVGIVPILEQVRAVLPNGSSSVKAVTVVWIDERQDDFDIISDLLEREYYKYTTKLAVSCVVENLKVNSLVDNMNIVNAIPEFAAGTMAVLSGPRNVQRKAANYLTAARGYPDDCICFL